MSMRAKLLALAMLGLLALTTAAQAANQMYSASLIIEAFGNEYSSPPFPPYGIPLGAHCNTKVDPGNICGATTLRDGAPLTGYGSLNDTTPMAGGARGFTFPASGLSAQLGTVGVVPGGSFPYFTYTPYFYTYADLRNQAGSFKAKAGPGSFSFVYTAGNRVAKAAVKAGPNQFGGVMRLLGTQQGKLAYVGVGGGYSTFRYNWLFDLVGESGMGTAYGKRYDFIRRRSYPVTVKATAFPWTTGTANVRWSRVGVVGSQRRKGYDNRTPTYGRGAIQLVSPLLTHVLAPSLGSLSRVGIGVLRIQLPEPGQWMMLVAGLGLLGVLYRARALGVLGDVGDEVQLFERPRDGRTAPGAGLGGAGCSPSATTPAK